jgi:hypothetical protein
LAPVIKFGQSFTRSAAPGQVALKNAPALFILRQFRSKKAVIAAPRVAAATPSLRSEKNVETIQGYLNSLFLLTSQGSFDDSTLAARNW